MADPRLAQNPTVAGGVRVGVVDFEVSPLGTAYSADASFERLGTIVPGSFKNNIARKMFDYARGLPKVAIKPYAIGTEGVISFDLDEWTARAVDVQNGGVPIVRTLTAATTVSVAPAPTNTGFTTAAAITGAVVGSWIAITTGGNTYDRKVLTISGTAVTFDPLPGGIVPVSGDSVARITASQVAGGGGQTVLRTGRMIFTDNYGDKSYLYLPQIATTGKFAIDPKNTQENAIIPMEFRLYGVQSTVNGVLDTYLFHHYFVPAV
jgi:hypothetical protein